MRARDMLADVWKWLVYDWRATWRPKGRIRFRKRKAAQVWIDKARSSDDPKQIANYLAEAKALGLADTWMSPLTTLETEIGWLEVQAMLRAVHPAQEPGFFEEKQSNEDH